MQHGKPAGMRVRLKGVSSATKTLADGRKVTYFYAWRGGPRLDGALGSPEFVASYRDAVAQRARPSAANLSALLDSYRDSEAFRGLAAKSAKDYARLLGAIGRQFGDMPLKLIGARGARGDFLAWRDELARTSRRGADYAFAVFARALSWALDRGMIDANPLERHGRVYRASRAEKVWSDVDEARLLACASAPIAVAFMLALWTGQRQGDVLRLGWSAYDGQFIRLRQSKTGVRVTIPVGAPLKALLDATPRRSPVIVTSSDSRPYTSDGFRASWRKTCERAGVAGLTFHDLRGTAVTRLAVAGATEMEIATITGHAVGDVKSILDSFYLNRDPAMAISAIGKLEKRTKLQTDLQTGGGGSS
jgi:integrase